MDKNDARIKILITGSSGQLGQAFQEVKDSYLNYSYVFLPKDSFDITQIDKVASVLDHYKPAVIINTAAYTAVDKAQENSEQANLINEIGVKNIAQEASKRDIALIHISTDYVFDGQSQQAYHPYNDTHPQTVYGISKLAGEHAILDAGLTKYAIIRTSWLYSKHGNNFVKTMLRLSSERPAIAVVDDQVGSPTWANDLAHAILVIASKLNKQRSGIYHYSNRGAVSWYAFAKAIFSHSKVSIKVSPVPTTQYPTLAERPQWSVLDTSKIEQKFGLSIPSWDVSLKKMLDTYDW